MTERETALSKSLFEIKEFIIENPESILKETFLKMTYQIFAPEGISESDFYKLIKK